MSKMWHGTQRRLIAGLTESTLKGTLGTSAGSVRSTSQCAKAES